jgi:hypothetical protein
VPHGIVHGAHVLSPRIFIGSFRLARWLFRPTVRRMPLSILLSSGRQALRWDGIAGRPMPTRSMTSAISARRVRSRHAGAGGLWQPQGCLYQPRCLLVEARCGTAERMRSPSSRRCTMRGWHALRTGHLLDSVCLLVGRSRCVCRRHEHEVSLSRHSVEGSRWIFLPKVDGGQAIDPSHPGAKARAAYYLQQFQKLGFNI